MARYTPPEQSKVGQIFDIAVVVVAIFVALWLPLKLGLAGAAKSIDALDTKTWDSLGQNATMAAIWEKLGYTPETAADIIASRFDYSFSIGAVLLTAAVLIVYFVFVVRYSDKEYREVIAERFGSGR